MQSRVLIFLTAASCAVAMAQSESTVSCADLANLKIEGVEITKTAPVSAGTTIPPMYPGARGSGPLPAHCRVDGVINRRKGAGGEEPLDAVVPLAAAARFRAGQIVEA